MLEDQGLLALPDRVRAIAPDAELPGMGRHSVGPWAGPNAGASGPRGRELWKRCSASRAGSPMAVHRQPIADGEQPGAAPQPDDLGANPGEHCGVSRSSNAVDLPPALRFFESATSRVRDHSATPRRPRGEEPGCVGPQTNPLPTEGAAKGLRCWPARGVTRMWQDAKPGPLSLDETQRGPACQQHVAVNVQWAPRSPGVDRGTAEAGRPAHLPVDRAPPAEHLAG